MPRSLQSPTGGLGGWIEERVEATGGFEPGFDERSRALRLAVKEAGADGEDDVEAAVAEVELLEAGDEELGGPGLDMGGVALLRGRDHPRSLRRGESV